MILYPCTLPRDRASVTARQDTALNMRERGMTYSKIAAALGFQQNQYTSGRESARRAVFAAAKRRAANGGIFARNFGIEIECVGVDRHYLAEQLAVALGTHVHLTGYHGSTCDLCHQPIDKNTWRVERDGSLRHRASHDYRTAEVVSPILKGLDGFEAHRKVIKTIAALGGTTNRSCGMHVHHDVEDMTGEQIAESVKFYNDRRELINYLVGASRRNNTYCKPYNGYELVEVVNSLTANRKGGSYAAKYRAVNVLPLGKYGTVEFRQHQGTTNIAAAHAWVKFGQSVLEAAKRGVSAQISTTNLHDMLDDMVTYAGLEPATATLLKGRSTRFFGYHVPATVAAAA